MSKKEESKKLDEEKTKENVTKSKEKKDNNIIILTVLVVAILAILLVINLALSGFDKKLDKDKDISSVKKVLGTKYNKISCVDSKCDYVVTSQGDELKKVTYFVYDLNGKKIASFKVDYSKKNSEMIDVISVTKNYIITRTIKNKKSSYTLRSTKGKAKYNSNNLIKIVSQNLASISEKDGTYKIVDKNGKIVIDSVKSFYSYAEGNYISIKKGNGNIIVDSNGKEILKKYTISNEIRNEDGNVSFLIIKNSDNNKYSYFDINKNKIVGDSFDSYNINDENEVIIRKTINSETKKFILKSNGKQEAYDKDLSDVYDNIQKNINLEDYYLFKYNLLKTESNNVVVNNKKDNSLGILNVKSNKYKKIFDYKLGTIYGALVSQIDEENSVVRITCSKSYCEKSQNIIYDISKNKKIYEEEKDNVLISEFTLYENNYKVIKYSYSSDNQYAGKSYLLNKKNKEIANSVYSIALIDEKVKFENSKNNNLILYTTKSKKSINSSKNLALRIKIGENYFYRYTDSKGNLVIFNSKGKKVVENPSSNYLTYSNSYIIYLSNNKINIFNTKKNKTKSYRLKKNEKLNNEYGDIVAPYRGVTFINNSIDKNVKVISPKGSTVRTIRNAEVSKVITTNDGKALIIVKSTEKNKDIYGLYIAK